MIRHPLACALITTDYAGGDECTGWQLIDGLNLDGCQATLWAKEGKIGGVLTGSNDGWDWSRNLVFLPGYSMQGDSGRFYHRGILDYSRHIYAWLKGKPIDWLTGHSLGGGICQIVGSSLLIPSYTIAAPKVLVPFQSQPDGATFVRNAVLPGDPVPWLVPGYQHIGAVCKLVPTSGWFGGRHGVAHYGAAKA